MRRNNSGFAAALLLLLLLAACGTKEAAAPDTMNASATIDEPEGSAIQPTALPPRPGETGANADEGARTSFCAALRTMATEEDCRSFQEQAASLETGIGAFNPPASMVRGETQDVTFAVGAQADAQEVVDSVGGNQAARVTVPTKIGRFMTATLSGSGFDIKETAPAERDLGASRSESWTWQVTPRAAGPQRLELRVSVEAEGADGKRTPIKLSSRIVDVQVAVSAAGRRSDRIQALDRDLKETTPLLGSLRAWLLAVVGVVAAASALRFALRRFGKPEKDDKPKPE